MTPEEYAKLEQALRHKWEADQVVEQIRARLVGKQDIPTASLGPKQPSLEIGTSTGLDGGRDETLPERVVALVRSKGTASVREILGDLKVEDPNTVRSTLSRLSRRGDLVVQQTDIEGVPIRGMYVYVGDKI